MDTINKYGLQTPKILLPKDNGMLTKWPVVACDQYTQEKAYWEKVSNFVGNAPSTLNLILPEVYLEDGNKEERIAKIRNTMSKYLQENVFKTPLSAMIYLERQTEYGRTRKGIITCIDLETYEWKPFSHALIRATEATIVDRIPPRMKIRQGALLESPHIMLLVNDSEKKLIEKTGELAKKENKQLYDISLMMNAGKISGWEISPEDSDIQTNITTALNSIKNENTDDTGAPFMFAVGDGNHSLATAKAVWDEYKTKEKITDHPARYALVEIVNIYDEGLTFEPIHRVLYDIDKTGLISFLQTQLSSTTTIKRIECTSEEKLEKKVKESIGSFGFVYKDEKNISHYTLLETSISDLIVSHVQPLIDDFLKTQPSSSIIDYIHGSNEVFRLGKNKNAITILLPPIAKQSFFKTISHSGPLPRKSFSMGEASEKRFYMESRKLF
ncbi:MAG: hypothetical protein BKP49_07220 [Treponema sp. CETP13]|nr:MAG: hypothetical protein BKP49_07220 [Treponema sp. CETP13]